MFSFTVTIPAVKLWKSLDNRDPVRMLRALPAGVELSG